MKLDAICETCGQKFLPDHHCPACRGRQGGLKGGRSKSERKLAAALKNLQRRRAKPSSFVDTKEAVTGRRF